MLRAERVPSGAVQGAGPSADAGKHFHRRDVQVRTLATPSLNDGVDLVPGWLAGHTRSLEAASGGTRTPPQGEGACGGVLPPRANDDVGGFRARCASSTKDCEES